MIAYFIEKKSVKFSRQKILKGHKKLASLFCICFVCVCRLFVVKGGLYDNFLYSFASESPGFLALLCPRARCAWKQYKLFLFYVNPIAEVAIGKLSKSTAAKLTKGFEKQNGRKNCNCKQVSGFIAYFGIL